MESLLDQTWQNLSLFGNPTVVIRQTLSGISHGMLLFLISAGLSLIFGVTRILNFAHGGLFMLGAYVAMSVIGLVLGGLPGFVLSLIAGAALLLLVGGALEILLLRRIYRSAHEFQLLLTFGLVFVIGDLVMIIWDREERSVAGPELLSGATRLIGVTFPTYRLFLILVGIAVAIALWVLLHRTRFGIWIRAATLDREMLGALGVNTRRLYTGVFALGAALAGFGGALAAPVLAVGPGLHVEVIIDAFVVVVIGGMGSIPGALVGSLLVGLVNAFGILAFPSLAVVLTFALMAVILIVRPWGLFGRPE